MRPETPPPPPVFAVPAVGTAGPFAPLPPPYLSPLFAPTTRLPPVVTPPHPPISRVVPSKLITKE
jgi:hypothetical protein